MIVTATTGIGFAGNVLGYALKVPAAKGQGFGFVMPKGRELFFVLSTGVIAGLIINKALSLVETGLKTKEEKALDTLFAEEKKKIESGLFAKDKNPTQVIWA